MQGVLVQIVRWVEDWQPGIVACELTDAEGQCWSFVEKLPIVTEEMLDARSSYPRPGVIACEVVETQGALAWIDTRRPWGVESTDGETRFVVPATSLIEIQE